jgi:hypothetical protein
MEIGSQRNIPSMRTIALVGCVAAQLVLATVLTGSADAQDASAVKVRDSSAGDATRSGKSSGTEAAGTSLGNTTGTPPDRPTGSDRKLTMQQKRIFVLGLGAGEKE